MTNGGMCGRERLRSDATRRGRRGYIAFGAEGGGGGPQLVAVWVDAQGGADATERVPPVGPMGGGVDAQERVPP